MKIATSFLMLIMLGISSHAQNTWIQKNDFAGTKRYAATTCVIGDKVYLGLGSNGSTFFSDWWAYDPSSDTWAQKADFGGGPRDVATAMVINGKAYAGFGASNLSTVKNDWWEYDPTTDSWTQKNDFPSAGRYGSSTFVIDGKGYVCCGNEQSAYGPFTNELWQYDPSNDTWIQKSTMPGYARYGTSGFTINGKGYSGFGGLKKANGDYMYFKDFYEYDPDNDTWTKKADYPSRRAYPVSFVLNDKAYVGLGDKQGVLHPEIYSYDPVVDEWTYATSFPEGGRFVALAFAVNGTAYVGCGAGDIYLSEFFRDIWQFTPQEKNAPPPSAGSATIFYAFGTHQLIPHLDHQGLFEFRLYDISGHIIQSALIDNDSPIDLNSDLPAGVYVATLREQNDLWDYSRKIVIQ